MTLVADRATFDELRGKLLSLRTRGWPEPFGFDTETFGPEFRSKDRSKPDATRHRIAGYSLAFLDGSRYYVPVRHPEQLEAPGRYKPCAARWKLLQVLTIPEARVVIHNAKFELAVLRNEGIPLRARVWDSMCLAWMAGWGDEASEHAKDVLGLKPLARHFLGHDGPDFDDVARGRPSNEIPQAEIAPYGADDAWLALTLGMKAYDRVVELDALEHFELEMRCVPVTEHMERTGVPIDRARLEADAVRCEREAEELAERFRELTRTTVEVPIKVEQPKPCPTCDGTGWVVEPGEPDGKLPCPGPGRKVCRAGVLHHRNGRVVTHKVDAVGRAELGARVGSDADVSRWLFEELKLWPKQPGHPEVDYGLSVKEEFIRPFTALDGAGGELCRLRLRYQALHKYASTYTRSLVALAEQAGDGKLHTSYNQFGTDTVRYSSSMPNQSSLPRSVRQNLPWMHDMPDIRAAFVAPPGWVVVIFDFSQIEMCVMAHYSRDPNLMACYKPGPDGQTVDVHERTRLAMQANSAVVVQRGDSKITNFATIYRISAPSLARKLQMGTNDFITYTDTVAQGFIDGFNNEYTKVPVYHERAIAYAQDRQYATTLTGFKRPITRWNERKFSKKYGRSISMYGYCCRQAINTPIQGSAGGILKRALVGLYETWKERGELERDVCIMGQTYDEIIVCCTPEMQGSVERTMKLVMEGAAPELRVPLVVEGGSGPNWSAAK